ncbi:MAG: hypothetical protein ACRBFS_18265 [Aureispira sp.]
MSQPTTILFGRLTFFFSLLFGSLIFGGYILTGSNNLLLGGLIYTVLAGLFNLLVLFLLLDQTKKEPSNKRSIFRTIGLMLVNLPIALFYAWFIMLLLNTMRITLVNQTGVPLTHLELEGCGSTPIIQELLPQKEQTLWVTITGDCSIQLFYQVNGQFKREEVVGYVTNNMGEKMTYVIAPSSTTSTSIN